MVEERLVEEEQPAVVVAAVEKASMALVLPQGVRRVAEAAEAAEG